MTDETRTRFLTAIARQIPAERVVELHLFAGIRQGGTESGVAVIAVEREAATDTTPIVDAVVISEDSPYAKALRPVSRYIVYSASYRLTLKGLDRGKWEVSITEEADAPLLTIDAVVRGVQRRSGDADETVRLSGAEFRAALPVAVG
jgi:hypothetical protein